MSSSSSKMHAESQTEKHVSELVRAMTNMSRKKIGALIVLERSTSLGDVVDSGTYRGRGDFRPAD